MHRCTLDRAVAARSGHGRGTVLHADRRSQYTASAMACHRHGLHRSMGATGICWDNAGAESLWSTFKHEHYYRHVYATKAELVAAVDKWMQRYNTRRRHSAIGISARSLTNNHSPQLLDRLSTIRVNLSLHSCEPIHPTKGAAPHGARSPPATIQQCLRGGVHIEGGVELSGGTQPGDHHRDQGVDHGFDVEGFSVL